MSNRCLQPKIAPMLPRAISGLACAQIHVIVAKRARAAMEVAMAGAVFRTLRRKIMPIVFKDVSENKDTMSSQYSTINQQ